MYPPMLPQAIPHFEKFGARNTQIGNGFGGDTYVSHNTSHPTSQLCGSLIIYFDEEFLNPCIVMIFY